MPPIQPEQINTQLAKRMRQLREQRQMSQDCLALHLYVSRQFVSELERGTKTISQLHIARACEAFQVTLSDFYSGIQARPPQMAPGQVVDYVMGTSRQPDASIYAT